MIAHGVNHWIGGGKITGTARGFAGLGLKQPVLQAWMSVVTEIGAGVLLVLGLLTSLAAAAVISVMLIAGLLAHRKNGFFVFKDGYEYVLVIAAACAALGALGPGRLSVDSAASIAVTGWDGFGVAVGRRRGGGRRPARHLLPPEGRLTGQLGGGCGDGFVVGLGVTLTCWE
jgi:putative oxidoreductase